MKPACPDCNSLDVIKRQAGHWWCKRCRWLGGTPNYREPMAHRNRAFKPVEQHQPAPGSGTVAGRITIGRGYNWKAGRV